MTTYCTDIAIVGGGIAGLWALNRLCHAGYDAVLIERDSLGAGQTLASQGIVHGGQRYLLGGKPWDHARALAPMPAIWRACLAGKAEVNLAAATILAREQHLWFPKPPARLGEPFAAQAVGARIDRIEPLAWPSAFRDLGIQKGDLYRLSEEVVDSRSIVIELARPWRERIYRAEVVDAVANGEGVREITLQGDSMMISLRARYFIFAAGLGNEKILRILRSGNRITQRRPLKQILARPMQQPIYLHCVSDDPRPRVTVTAHPLQDGTYVWYLGGLVADRATELSDEDAIAFAADELRSLFPALDQRRIEWAAYSVDRAEAFNAEGLLPVGAVLKTDGNAAFAWPTKMTLAPALADKIFRWLADHEVPKRSTSTTLPLSRPRIAQPAWLRLGSSETR